MTVDSEKYWDNMAERWHRRTPMGDADKNVCKYVNETLGSILKNENGLVLNIGSGADTKEYFKGLRNLIMVNLDRSRGMLRYHTGEDKVQADAASALPFKEAVFDNCISIFLMRYLKPDEQKQLIGAIRRTLKNGGCMVLIDLINNYHPRQQSSFQPAELALFGERIGLNEVTYSIESRQVIERVNYGFGYSLDKYEYLIGMVSGRK